MTRRVDWGLVTAVALAIVVALPLASPPFVGAHDAFLSVYRGLMHGLALQDGVLFPRWSPEFFFGYGYPLFNYYAPLSSLAVALLALAAPLPMAVEIGFALAIVAGAAGCYVWLRRPLGAPAALVASAAYSLAPFHLVDVYLRGGLPELAAMALFPWLLWSLQARADWRLATVRAALVFAALIMTHNVMALLFAPVAAVYALGLVLLRRSEWREGWHGRLRLLAPLAGLALGVGLAAFFWLPALAELGAVQPANLTRNALVDFRNFFADAPISGVFASYGQWIDGEYSYPLQAGLVQLLAAAGGGVVGAIWCWRQRRGRALLAFGVAGAALCFAATLGLSRPVWELLPLAGFVQYPWRWLGPLSLFTALLTGYLVAWARPRLGWALAAVVVVVIGATSLWQLAYREVALDAFTADLVGAQLFESMTDTIGTTSIGEYVPAQVTYTATSSAVAHERMLGLPPRWVTAAGVEVTAIERRTHQQSFRLELAEATTVVLPLVDFPGWRLSLDGQAVAHEQTAQTGLIALAVPAGSHVVVAQLGLTPPRLAGEIVSWLAVLIGSGLVGSIGWNRRRRLRAAVVGGAWADAGVLAGGLALMASIVVLGDRLAPLPGPLAGYPEPRTLGGARILPPRLPGEVGVVSVAWDEPAAGMAPRLHVLSGGRTTREIYQARPLAVAPEASPDQAFNLALPPGSPPGPYQAAIEARVGERRLPIGWQQIGRSWLPGPLVALPPFVLQPGAPPRASGYPIDAVGEPGRLDGVTLSSTIVRPGGQLLIDPRWTPNGLATRNLITFVHLLTPDFQLVAQVDAAPGGGMYPTTAWLPGMAFQDRLVLMIPPDLAAGRYQLAIGMYEPAAVRRIGWTLADGNQLNQIPITTIEVIAP